MSDEQILTLPPPTRAGWPSGPWDTEPDRVLWRDGDIVCLARRSMNLGAWCGYVGVGPNHPWQALSYERLDRRVSVHGGLTYAKACQPEQRDGCEFGICHTPEAGETDHIWWVGFDCAHAGDRVPCEYAPEPWQRMFGAGEDLGGGDVYRDLAFVKAQIGVLTAQAKAAARNI
jgi:hypothetical protein